MITKEDFQVKNLKQIQGNDGYVFSCTIYIKGKIAFTVFNDGNGAPNQYNVIDKKLYAETEKLITEYSPVFYMGLSMDYTMDLFVDDLLDEYEHKKLLKKWCKTKTVFRLPNDEIGAYRTISKMFTEEIKNYLKKKYPDVEIVNENLPK